MHYKTTNKFISIALLVALPFIVKAESSNQSSFAITPFIGYRYDIYQWSIPQGDSTKDKKLSELTWKNHVLESGIKLETEKVDKKLNFLGQFKYGLILDKSTSQDSDWDDIGEYSRSSSKVKGSSIDISGAVGYSQAVSQFLITYYLGMDYTNYNLKNYGLYNKISREPETNNIEYDYLGERYSKSKLTSKYKFDNYAPWVGVSMYYPINKQLSIAPFVKLYGFYLESEADWVLREDVKHNPSFTDKAYGYGASLDTEILYKHNDNLDFRTNLSVKGFKMTKGKKKAFAIGGESDITKLKALTFISSSISAGIKYKL